MWEFSLEGRVLNIHEKKFKVVEQLTEVLDQRMGQRNVLVKARNIENNIMSYMKICYQLDLKIFVFSDNKNKENMEIATDHFCHEVQAVMLLSEAGFRLVYISYKRQT